MFDSAFPFVSRAPSIDPNPVFTREQIVLGTFPEKPHPKGYDDGDKGDKGDKGEKGDDGGRKGEATKKASKDADEPRAKTMHVEHTYEGERYRRPRREANDAKTAVKGLNIMLGIGGGLKFGGGGGHRGKY